MEYIKSFTSSTNGDCFILAQCDGGNYHLVSIWTQTIKPQVTIQAYTREEFNQLRKDLTDV